MYTFVRLMILRGAVLVGCAAFALPALADSTTAGYADTIDQTGYTCATHPAYTENTGATIETYMEFVDATTDSITFQVIPSFDDNTCAVKLPMGYDNFEGVEVDYTDDIQTPVADRPSMVVNATGDGEFQVTLTGLNAGTEYQFRSGGIFTLDEGGEYATTLGTSYYSTAVPPVTDVSIATDGTVSWTNPAGVEDGNVKIDITFYEVVGGELEYVVGTTKYATSGESYEYYDFYNNLYGGDYVVVLTASMKKFYDSLTENDIDQRIWGTPVALAFSTYRGEVVASAGVDESADLSDCVDDPSDGAGCSSEDVEEFTVEVAPEAPVFGTVTKKMVKWSAVDGANYYKLVVKTKKGKKLFSYNNIIGVKKEIKKKHRKLLGAKAKYYLYACNDAGCSEATLKNKTF